MLLIFDLDDTLIETTSFLTQMKLEKALDAMIDSGLKVKDTFTANRMLQRMNLGAKSTKNAVMEFVELCGGDQSHFRVAYDEIQKVDLDSYPIERDEEIIELLEELKQDHMLAIVTRGDKEVQKAKLLAFGLSETLFCETIITPFFDKGDHYAHLSKKYETQASQMMVIGDRIDVDLKDAKKMGAHTVHIRKGRGANYEPRKDIVDFTIYDLGELRQILENQEKLVEIV